MSWVNIRHNRFDVLVDRTTIFGNPFVVGKDGSRHECLAKYHRYLWNRIKTEPAFRAKVGALHGKVLGCWCAPYRCHAAQLHQAAKVIAAENAEFDRWFDGHPLPGDPFE